MAVRFSGARPIVANRFRICRRLNPASIRIRASSVSTYAQLPAEPLPKIVKRTGMADIKEKATTQQYFCQQENRSVAIRSVPVGVGVSPAFYLCWRKSED